VDELLKSAKPVSGKTPWNPPEVRKSELSGKRVGVKFKLNLKNTLMRGISLSSNEMKERRHEG
jgi:hypothetical protein